TCTWKTKYLTDPPDISDDPVHYADWDATTVFNVAVQEYGGQLLLWYHASNNPNLKYNPSGLGLAYGSVSNPDAAFTRAQDAPVIMSGSLVTWNATGDTAAWDWKIDGAHAPFQDASGNWRIYYKGGDYHPTDPLNRKFQIGLTT